MMTPLFTGGFLGKMSSSVTSHVVIPLTCLLSILFYQFVAELGSSSNIGNFVSSDVSPKKSKFQLRSNRNNRPTITPLISGFDPHISDFDLDPSIDGNTPVKYIIPACARDVFVTLHKEAGGENEHACEGLLIRDDIIITSNECSKINFTFEFEGSGIVHAVPHTSLNSKEKMVDSRLGFLEVSAPYHYHLLHRPVRRKRIFLSNRSTPRVNGTEVREAVIMTCGDRHEPIAHNFPNDDGEMVPLVELAGIVPDDILWEEMDINTAPMLEYKSHRWWTRPIMLKEEEETFKEMFVQWQGPPGSVSIPDAHKDFPGKASALCEALDPRGHRRPDCFKNYYIRYRTQKPFSGMHFFDWLDFGHGKFLLEENAMQKFLPYMKMDRKCYKKDFNRKKVHYFNDEERSMHEIYVAPSKDGKQLVARYKHNDELVPASDPDEPHLYMWDLNETFYIVDNTWDKEKYGTVKHTGVVAGQPALSGGKAYFGEHGAIWGINYSSGHYRPHIQAAAMMYQWMKDRGFNLTALHWVGRESWSTKDCWDTDWNSIKIRGFNATALNQSCHEVTVSPTWILKQDV